MKIAYLLHVRHYYLITVYFYQYTCFHCINVHYVIFYVNFKNKLLKYCSKNLENALKPLKNIP